MIGDAKDKERMQSIKDNINSEKSKLKPYLKRMYEKILADYLEFLNEGKSHRGRLPKKNLNK